MANLPQAHANSHKDDHTSPTMYIIGYILSVVLTVAALWLTLGHVMTGAAVIWVDMILAAAQVFVQLFFFMHITEKQAGPRYNVMALILGAIFLIAIVGGSVWIMEFNSVVQ